MKKVLVGGVFNIIHPGHIFFLGKAREFGDHLTVVVANDKNVLQKKGYLIFSSEERAEMVQNLKHVDNAVIGNENDLFKVVEEEKPQTIVLGYDQDFDIKALKEFIEQKKLKCKIVKLPEKYQDYSTTAIIDKIKKM